MADKTILLCAGGTGGHLFPAEALAHVLTGRGYKVHLALDERVQKFSSEFPAETIHEIPSASLSSYNPIRIAGAFRSLYSGYRQSRALLHAIKPVAVAGFGGYPTLPPVYAAARMGIPTLVHDANAVPGRANRFLASRVSRVVMGFEGTPMVGGKKVLVTGNPVRPAVLKAAKTAYPKRQAGEPFSLLVFGGSQGAQYFSQVMPLACQLLPAEYFSRLRIVQQARPEDRETLVDAFRAFGMRIEAKSFFDDMAARISGAHLVVSRAGASTVSELAVIGRPAILVPYPHALDHDQAANAAVVEKAGGAVIISQQELTPERLAAELKSAMDDPERLALAAENAKKTGKPNAAEVLADCLTDL